MVFTSRFPVTFIHDLNVIPSLSQGFLFIQGGLVNFIEGAIRVIEGKPIVVDEEASGTPVP